MTTYSYHIFYFPFQWNIKGKDFPTLSEKTDFGKIKFNPLSFWKRNHEYDNDEAEQMYNEKNYYYKFVHNVLYDNYEKDYTDNIILHFERDECKVSDNIYYNIKVSQREKPFVLKVDSMNINLYASGVGILTFYLSNREESQSDPESVLLINQYGRRIMPPFYKDIQMRTEISEYISIEGLSGNCSYKENFKNYSTDDSWKQASFINNLIEDLSPNIIINPIIDDRMFVASWYKNNELSDVFTNNTEAYRKDVVYEDIHSSDKIKNFNKFSKFWYRFIFIDGGDETCKNTMMKEKYLEEHSYIRWQKYSSLYGCCRYSMVYLTSETCPDYLLKYFETIYARMVELVLIQRASILRFSDEVAKVSNLNNKDVKILSERVGSIYKEYIRFINQMFFRDVTAQDQGIELYNMLQKNLKLMEYLKDLDGEIQEQFNYISLKEDRIGNEKVARLNRIAIRFVPISFIAGFFGMNPFGSVINWDWGFLLQFVILLLVYFLSLKYIKKL